MIIIEGLDHEPENYAAEDQISYKILVEYKIEEPNSIILLVVHHNQRGLARHSR